MQAWVTAEKNKKVIDNFSTNNTSATFNFL